MKTLFIVYDNKSYISRFPQNVAYLINYAQSTNVSVYHQDIHHYDEQHLIRYLDNYEFDFVCLGFIGGYYQYHKAKKIAEAVNKSKNRDKFKFILGGHGPSPEPSFFLKKLKADIVVIGEGEKQLEEITHGFPLYKVNRISYRINEVVYYNDLEYKLMDIDNIQWPMYNKFDMNYYRLFRYPNCDITDFTMPVLSGRGCPYKCNFCYRMHKGFRQRDIHSVVEEIQYLQRNWKISYISFNDELLMTSVDRIEEMCKHLKPLGIKWNCNGRLNIASKELNILKFMKESGCVFINYGIESIDDNVLKCMNKKLNTKQITQGVENTKKVGISSGLNIIFGNYGDNISTLQEGRRFLMKYGDTSQLRTIRPVTPYPGSQLYDDAIKQGLIKDCEDFYENKHTNSDLLTCNFTKMKDSLFYDSLEDCNISLVNKYYQDKLKESSEQIKKLYRNKDETFRGFRDV